MTMKMRNPFHFHSILIAFWGNSFQLKKSLTEIDLKIWFEIKLETEIFFFNGNNEDNSDNSMIWKLSIPFRHKKLDKFCNISDSLDRILSLEFHINPYAW